ncbi:YkgJ family cysteine cluster protein [Candidatus Woesearchaeota archaeon]|nr:YkgJ family cysteine cluster protein [Candidatus Woesearchaeota archaeon]
MPPKFRCIRCGECCSHIRGIISDDEKEFIRKYAYGQLPLVQIFPIERMSFPLFDFEAKRFRGWQKEADVDAKIMPSRVVFDLNSNKSIIITYYMDYDSCPFLKDNRCLIYDKKRAFICRLFPFNKGPFLKTGEELRKEDMFGSCPSIKGILPELDDKNRKELVKKLYQSFGDNFLNIIEYDYLTEWVNRLIITLIKEERIKPAMNYPYKYLLRRIMSSEKIDLMDFLIEKGIKTPAEIENLINGFDNNIDAGEKLREFLG